MPTIDELEAMVKNKRQEMTLFETPKQEVAPVGDKKGQLVDDMFEQAVVHEVATNLDLKEEVLDAAKTYTSTKMKVIKTKVDTELKEASFDNCKAACESYGFKETSTPIWAQRFMTKGYNVMLAIWLVIGSFTFMPVIFITKKIAVGIKNVWIAVIIALIIYLGATFVPILIGILNR